MAEVGRGGDFAGAGRGAIFFGGIRALERRFDGAGLAGKVGRQALGEGAVGVEHVGGVGGRGQFPVGVAVADEAILGRAVEPEEEPAHRGIGEHGVGEVGRAYGDDVGAGRVGRPAHATCLAAGKADVAGGPAGVGAGGDVEVAGGVDGVGAGDGAIEAGEGEAGGVGGGGGVGPAGEELGAAGVAGRDELIGAAVGEIGGAGLLAHGGVGAGGREEFEALIFGGPGAPFVFGDDAEVIGGAGLQAGDFDLDRAGAGPFERFGARRDGPVGGGRAVFEAAFGRLLGGEDLGVDLGFEVGGGGGEVGGGEGFDGGGLVGGEGLFV